MGTISTERYRKEEEEEEEEGIIIGDNNGERMRYVIVGGEKASIGDVLGAMVWWDKRSLDRLLLVEAVDGDDREGGVLVGIDDHRWVIIVSVIVRKMLTVMGRPMEWCGCFLEFLLNLLSHNGQLLGLIYNLLTGKVVIPERNSATFMSAIGHLDGRIDLYNYNIDGESTNIIDTTNNNSTRNRALTDLCIMASKLAYENPNFIKNIVTHHWKMHLVEFFDGWNDFQKERSTQVFILCDKPKDANLILVSFRGTEPFDADDWSTDFDYSWYEIPKIGKVHMGFLEALGLGNRADAATFLKHLRVGTHLYQQNTIQEDETVEMTAYYAVKCKLKSLLDEHKNAKFIITGHSLGGALAVLFPTILLLHEEKEIMERLLVVYTFGQPRVGDWELGRLMEAQLNNPIPRYFRLVYCNDLVPRLPYDNRTFLFKHFGHCLYFDSNYTEQNVEEEPNKNYFGVRYLVPEYLNAVWELIRGFSMRYIYGEGYKEGWFSILLRVMGLAVPGISAHSPTDYVNSVRLGKQQVLQVSSI